MRTMVLASVTALTLAACGGGFPVPSDRLSSAEGAARSARELQAQNDPQATLHLRLADEQIESAKAAIKDGDNKRADELLQRASADAELAVQLAKEAKTKAEAKEVMEKVAQLKAGNK